LPPHPLQKGGLLADGTDVTKGVWLVQKQIAELSLADADRVREHGLKHGLQFAGRTGDDAQHFGSGGLLLQGFAQLVEEAGVLDGDDGLSGEVRNQFNLLFGKWPYFLAVDADSTDELIVLEHGHGDKGAGAAEIRKRDRRRRALDVWHPCPNVVDLHDLLSARDLGKTALRIGLDLLFMQPRVQCLWHTVESYVAVGLAVIEVEDAELGPTQSRRVRQYGLENRLQFARRA
jgi:hypothetical protein